MSTWSLQEERRETQAQDHLAAITPPHDVRIAWRHTLVVRLLVVAPEVTANWVHFKGRPIPLASTAAAQTRKAPCLMQSAPGPVPLPLLHLVPMMALVESPQRAPLRTASG
jgi:hypothetical protein